MAQTSHGTTINEGARDVPVIAEVDVLVVGGGPSGVAAALGATRHGARVMLIERYGYLGGGWTSALILTLAGYNSWLRPYPRCVGGVGGEWLRRAAARGFAEDNKGWVLNTDPEGMKVIADEMIEESGMMRLYHTWCAMPHVVDGVVQGAFVENVDGRGFVRAKVTIDCTGNGDIMVRAGADWEKSDVLQPLTLLFDLGNARPDPAIPHDAPAFLPIGPDPVFLAGDLLKTRSSRRLDVALDYDRFARDREKGSLPIFGGPWVGGPHKDVVWMNTVRVVADPTVASELTTAEIQGRKDVFTLTGYFRSVVPGLEHGRVQRMGAHIGVRETRRLKGLVVLTGEDIHRCTQFPDSIGLGCWGIDLHHASAEATSSVYAPLPYPIPYRALVPRNVGGLLCAGRCISVDREAHGSTRIGATCCVTGHAAGVAAAIAADAGIQPAHVEPSALQQGLRRQDAILALA